MKGEVAMMGQSSLFGSLNMMNAMLIVNDNMNYSLKPQADMLLDAQQAVFISNNTRLTPG